MMQKYLSPIVLLGTIALLACSSTTTGGGSGGNGGAGGNGGNGGAGGSGGSGGGFTLTCFDASITYPPVSKACTTDADCAITLHPIDCCGSLAAIGLQKADVTAIEPTEKACQAKQICDCPTKPTTTEDGKTAADPTTIQITCNAGSCSTFLP